MNNYKDTTFCPLPWIHLATHPDGKATLCCISDHVNNASAARNFVDEKVKHLNLNINTVSEIMNSDFYKQTRLEMLGNIQPKACTRCYTEESNEHQSKRIQENKKFNFSIEDAKLLTETDGTIEPNLKFIELRLGNICNIKCRTCNPNSSSKWVGEYSKLQKELPFVTAYPQKIVTDWVDSDEFWNDLLNSSKNLEVVYVNGGEPTLVEKHWGYLEKLIEHGYNKNITLWYNINLTNLPDKLIELWKQFNKVQVFGSIDDLGERNSYIRTGTNWDTVLQNLEKLKNNDWIDTSICQTVSWMNIYYLDEFYNFMESKNLKVHLNLVYDPKFFDPCVLPFELKKIVLDKISKIDSEKFNFLEKHLHSNWIGTNNEFKQGIDFNKWLDLNRNQNFEICFPEWSKHITSYYETRIEKNEKNDRQYLDYVQKMIASSIFNKRVLEIASHAGLISTAIKVNSPAVFTLIEPDPGCELILKNKFPDDIVIKDNIYHFYHNEYPVDTVVCFGLLYHLHSPIYLMELIVNQSNPEYIIFDNISSTESTNTSYYGVEQPDISGNRFVGNLTKKVAKLNNSIPLNIMNQAMEDLGYKVDWVDTDIVRFKVFSKFGFIVQYKKYEKRFKN